MTEVTGNSAQVSAATADANSDLGQPSRIKRWARGLATVFRVGYVRLRFFLLLGVLAVVIGGWEDLQAWTDRARDWVLGISTPPEMISPEIEYFCPMCPGVVTRWPEKCPVCKMPLVRRKIGDVAVLPNGVVARMQLTPYRIQLAGVRTVPATYQPLSAEIHGFGTVVRPSEGKSAAIVQVSMLDAPLIRAGYPARIRITGDVSKRFWSATVVNSGAQSSDASNQIDDKASATDPARPKAKTADDSRPWIQLDLADDQPWPPENTACTVTISAPLADREPFVKIPHDAPPLSEIDSRFTYRCPDHPGYLFLNSGKCPFDKNELVRSELQANDRVEFWCPAHPTVTARTAGSSCAACNDLALIPRIVTYWPAGMVLTVPDTAIIEAGAQTIVFVESGPGMFDGRVVEIGPFVGGFASVVRGISAGDRVVVTSAFLLDAETRLNPAVASAYFGAATNGSADANSSTTTVSKTYSSGTELDKFEMTPRDRALAMLQRTCPVTNLPLGSMGEPIRVELPEITFYMCCEGCRGELPKRTQVSATTRDVP